MQCNLAVRVVRLSFDLWLWHRGTSHLRQWRPETRSRWRKRSANTVPHCDVWCGQAPSVSYSGYSWALYSRYPIAFFFSFVHIFFAVIHLCLDLKSHFHIKWTWTITVHELDTKASELQYHCIKHECNPRQMFWLLFNLPSISVQFVHDLTTFYCGCLLRRIATIKELRMFRCWVFFPVVEFSMTIKVAVMRVLMLDVLSLTRLASGYRCALWGPFFRRCKRRTGALEGNVDRLSPWQPCVDAVRCQKTLERNSFVVRPFWWRGENGCRRNRCKRVMIAFRKDERGWKRSWACVSVVCVGMIPRWKEEQAVEAACPSTLIFCCAGTS